MFINIILIINGVYDLVCAASILWLHEIPFFSTFSKLHPKMFIEQHSDHHVIQRLLSYWIITYGMVRIMAGFHRDNALYMVAALTYFIEAFCFEYESRVFNTMVSSKVMFVSMTSIIIGIFIIRDTY